MRVQTEEWRRFIPGVRMYKGKKTCFYNGEKLWDEENRENLIYDEEELHSWEVIIVLPGVEVIPVGTFSGCENLKTVIMSDSVRRIENCAFEKCKSLAFVKLSRHVEYIRGWAFHFCESLTSIFIPPSCREIGDKAFQGCKKLIILHVPQHTQLGKNVIADTALIKASFFQTDDDGEYITREEVNDWIKSHHDDNQFSLHRACSTFNPLDEVIFDIVKRQGLKAFNKTDSIGVTPSQYLSNNSYSEIKEQKIIKRYILHMMGEII
ncbi:hypothetical protein CTEN210_01147 [Chaetoceros tenuissimus]|uniref:Leucine-rich repeat domain-containing protein n=1 Tax=Chaetoceros tenuissimus TaxID=426638 RepID=A0AAD3GZL5_9STRA|nr:hypothetical protein CTEN210_01147 [Chaetoceros tenuissimus]